jgi:phytoene dehydrogenase-like protein
VRLDAPALRLAYGSDGIPVGVDLLSGERVNAHRAIISNLTIWDTYGKLVGLAHTPKEIAAKLKRLSAWGAYLLFLSIDDPKRLPASRILIVCDRTGNEPYAPERDQLSINMSPDTWGSDHSALTVTTFAHAQDWFSFHEDTTSHEQQDQAASEFWWRRLHQALPELGDSVELIETATPQTFYETTRRRFGMIGHPASGSANVFDFSRTAFPNLFLVGDTSSQGIGLEAVAQTALALADLLAH